MKKVSRIEIFKLFDLFMEKLVVGAERNSLDRNREGNHCEAHMRKRMKEKHECPTADPVEEIFDHTKKNDLDGDIRNSESTGETTFAPR